MKVKIRVICVTTAVCFLLAGALPCLGAGQRPAPEKQKVTVNDPKFIPITPEQVIAKPTKWYFYALGVGVLAGLAGGGGSGSSSSPGSVTVGW